MPHIAGTQPAAAGFLFRGFFLPQIFNFGLLTDRSEDDFTGFTGGQSLPVVIRNNLHLHQTVKGLTKRTDRPDSGRLMRKPAFTAPYHSWIITPKRFSKSSQIARGVPALRTRRTGLSASSGFGGSL